MSDKLFEAIYKTLDSLLDRRDWSLAADPKTVAAQIKAAVLAEAQSGDVRMAMHQPMPMFNQAGQPGLIGEAPAPVEQKVEKLIQELLDLAETVEMDASERTTLEDGLKKVASAFRL